MIPIAISGACGRMAGQVLRRAVEDDELKVVAAIDASNSPDIGRDVGEVLGVGDIGVKVVGANKLEEELQRTNPKLLVDFTNPKACVENVKVAAANKIGIVAGTTGLSDSQFKEIQEAVKKNNVAGMYASNFSIGMNVLFKLAEETARTLEDYDIEIIEAHHSKKKDAPSGTAMELARRIARSIETDLAKSLVYGRKGMVGERKPKEIGVHAIRAGDIAGEHTVLFGATGERLELKYMAHSRDAFAMGCIRAIKWMSRQKPGFYDMGDVIGLNG